RDEDNRKAFHTVQEARSEYLPTLDTLIQMILDGKRNEAVKYLATAVEEKQAPYFRAVEALVQLQTDNMHMSAESAAETYQTSFTATMIIAISSILVAIVIAFWIARSITRPIGEAVLVANRLADGDLSVRIEA